MPVLRSLAMYAIRRAAADPRVRAGVARVVREEAIPRARQAWALAKPKAEAARRVVRRTLRDAGF